MAAAVRHDVPVCGYPQSGIIRSKWIPGIELGLNSVRKGSNLTTSMSWLRMVPKHLYLVFDPKFS